MQSPTEPRFKWPIPAADESLVPHPWLSTGEPRRPLLHGTLEDLMPLITVLIAVENALFRAGLRLVLASQEDLRVVGETTDGRRTLHLVETLQPDILLLDLQMLDAERLAILPQLHARSPRTYVLLLSGVLDDTTIAAAVQNGARGYLPKTATPDELIKAIRTTYAGELWVRRTLLTQVLEHLRQQVQRLQNPQAVRRETLTAREQEIVQWVQQGLTNKQIATQLGISDKTVKAHLHTIFWKLQVRRRVYLLRGPFA